jgi:GNAT superfamily N-acetyltransferase
MNEIKICPANVEDVPVIHTLLAGLEEAMGTTGKVQCKVDDLRRFGFSDSPCFQALIAWRGTEAVGLALFFREFSSWKGVPGVYVQDLYVTGRMRGTGLGRELMEAVYQFARRWDADYCKLATRHDNEAAIAFYKRLGFNMIEDECVLVLEGL